MVMTQTKKKMDGRRLTAVGSGEPYAHPPRSARSVCAPVPGPRVRRPRPGLLVLLALFLLSALPVKAFEFTTTLPAPRGTAPVIDGERADGEWDDAVRVELLGGAEMLLKHDDEFLFVLIESKAKGIASVCVERSGGVAILHASAALGTAFYKGGMKGSTLDRPFFFELRDTGMSLEAKKARKTFLSQELWFANTSKHGASVREMQISLDIAPEHGRIPMAVTWYMFDDGVVAYWPEDLSDGCLNLEVIKGNTPQSLDFEPHRWPIVTIESMGMPVGDR